MMKKTINERLASETPAFFKKLRSIGLAVTAAAVAIISAPVSFGVVLPASIITAAGYFATAGSVLAAVSSLTTTEEKNSTQGEESATK